MNDGPEYVIARLASFSWFRSIWRSQNVSKVRSVKHLRGRWSAQIRMVPVRPTPSHLLMPSVDPFRFIEAIPLIRGTHRMTEGTKPGIGNIRGGIGTILLDLRWRWPSEHHEHLHQLEILNQQCGWVTKTGEVSCSALVISIQQGGENVIDVKDAKEFETCPRCLWRRSGEMNSEYLTQDEICFEIIS
jgi:hypothetical protein